MCRTSSEQSFSQVEPSKEEKDGSGSGLAADLLSLTSAGAL
jgi:hypothetical protein